MRVCQFHHRRILILIVGVNSLLNFTTKIILPYGILFVNPKEIFYHREYHTLTAKRIDGIILGSALSARKEVEALAYIISFVISVAASVIGYYICKWLGRK